MVKQESLESLKKQSGDREDSVVSVGYRLLGPNGVYRTIRKGGGLLVEGRYVATTSRVFGSVPARADNGTGHAEYFAEVVAPAEKDLPDEDEEFEDMNEEEYDMARMTLLDSDDRRGISIFALSGSGLKTGPRKGGGFSMNDEIFQNGTLDRCVEALN